METMKMSFENLDLQIPLFRDEQEKIKEILSISTIIPMEITLEDESFVLMSQESFEELMESEDDLEEILQKQQEQFREEFYHKQSKQGEEACCSCSLSRDFYPEEEEYDWDEEYHDADTVKHCFDEIMSQLTQEERGSIIMTTIMDFLADGYLSREQLVHLSEIVEAHDLLATAREIYGVEGK